MNDNSPNLLRPQSAATEGRSDAGGGVLTPSQLGLRGAHECAPPPRPSIAAEPRSTSKPIRAIRLRPGGRCGCTRCLTDEQLDNELRDQALAAIVYDLGAEALRRHALDRVPAFHAAFEAAS